MIGQGDGLNLQLAWAYAILRIAHSLAQATWNRVAVRFALFCLATAALLGLALHAAIAVLRGACGRAAGRSAQADST